MPDTHDPVKFVTDLRDHLARHDKPIAFLFGAGTSCAVTAKPSEDDEEERPLIPATLSLTASCRQSVVDLGIEYEAAWNSMEGECPTGRGHPNVEDILSKVRIKHEAMGATDTL